MAWVETQSISFAARHETSDAEAAHSLLERLEKFRAELDGTFDTTPWGISVVIHPSALQLNLAQPWLPLARLAAAPASRRYFAGWFSSGEIHVLSPEALRSRASRVPGSREALALSPMHEYAHLVVGANNAALPPPFNPGSFRRYVEWAWLCEGAATYFSGQTRHLRPAIVRRLREGGKASFPPSTRDAHLLGGTVFGLLAEGDSRAACVALASSLDPGGPRAALERAFARPVEEVEQDWRDYLAELAERPGRRRGPGPTGPASSR
jgi:hypothetical protein